jgi:FKBP-type peptidyl-prolyl cis-trans isomerase SlyD
MASKDTVADGMVVTFHYTMRDSDGEVIESSEGLEPMEYLHGAGNIVAGLEAGMAGHGVGDRFTIEVSPAQGFGSGEDRQQVEVPLSDFPSDMELDVGMPVEAELPDGGSMRLWVVAMDENSAVLDKTHPLAGETLHYEVELVGLRKASAEEKAHGHAHGPGGHDH